MLMSPLYTIPLTIPSYSVCEGIKLFSAWLSSYHVHGYSAHEIEYRSTPLRAPPPTILTGSPDDFELAVLDGSNEIHLQSGVLVVGYLAKTSHVRL